MKSLILTMKCQTESEMFSISNLYYRLQAWKGGERELKPNQTKQTKKPPRSIAKIKGRNREEE